MFIWNQNIMIIWHHQNIKVKVFASTKWTIVQWLTKDLFDVKLVYNDVSIICLEKYFDKLKQSGRNT